MHPIARRSLPAFAVVVYAVALACCVGCHVFGGAPDDATVERDASHSAGDSASKPTKSAAGILADDGWVRRTSETASNESGDDAPRWRHPDLEYWLDWVPNPGDELAAALPGTDPIVATNAAIGLARLGETEGIKRLALSARDTQLKLPLRLAAVEALASLDDPLALSELRALTDDYGRFTGAYRSRYVPDLHAELVRGLARHASAQDASRLTEALASPAPLVRRETLGAWRGPTAVPLPKAAAELRFDADPQVRIAALATLAARMHPEAEEMLSEALADEDLDVRLATIAALGTLSGEGPRARLKPLLENQPELVRQAAVRALARSGDAAAVLAAAADKSWRVRLAVAQSLGKLPGRAAASVAADLVHDASPEVQVQLVKSVADWPLEAAGPLLLTAIERGTYLARQSAVEQLAQCWPAAEGFPTAGPADRRAERLAELRRQWSHDFGSVVLASATVPVEPPTESAPAASADSMAEAERLLDELARLPAESNQRPRLLDDLTAFGPPLIGVLQRRVFDDHRLLDEDIWRQVLPRLDPTFKLVESLADNELAERRQAADQLAGAAAEAPLAPLAVERIDSICVAEPDSLVWRSLLTAVADDASEPALRLAAMTVSHPQGEVRRRACEHLGRYGKAEHAPLVLPALEDPDPNVVAAAVAALGSIGGPDCAPALERLLAHPHHGLRVEVAAALTRIGSPAGPAALDRLTWDADEQVRRQTAIVMGELADPACTAALIRLLDDQAGVQRAALDSLPQVTGRDVAAESSPLSATPDRIRCWKEWWQGQHSFVAPQ